MKVKLVTAGLLIQEYDTETGKFVSVGFDSRGELEWTDAKSGRPISEKEVKRLNLADSTYIVDIEIKED